MLEQIADAIKLEDYATAGELLAQLQEQEPTNPWIDYYIARLAEANGDLASASQGYRHVLQNMTHPKIIAQARQGMQRLEQQKTLQHQQEQADRQVAIAQALETPGSKEMGLLILEPIPPDEKQAYAQKFGQIMGIDAYTARLQLPSRTWRIYRIGAIGQLNVYRETLNKADIPCFCVKISTITDINVYPVLYFESLEPQVTVVYEPQKNQRDIFTFSWSEVTQRVEGLLPIFEECVEFGVRGKLQRKTKTLDYLKLCDLHLGQKNTIIRLCDQNYAFQQGIRLSESKTIGESQSTTQTHWVELIRFLNEKLPDIPIVSDFTPFGESAIEFPEMLKLIDSHLNILRREESPWDAAFQLYSALVSVKNAQE